MAIDKGVDDVLNVTRTLGYNCASVNLSLMSSVRSVCFNGRLCFALSWYRVKMAGGFFVTW